jgi:glycerate 2-kinase
MVKIVVAPDSFKGSVSAVEACEAMALGIRRAMPEAEIVEIPMADGGEGTVEALTLATNGHIRRAQATGPLGEKIETYYGILGTMPGMAEETAESQKGMAETAVIEMAGAAGLPLVPPGKRNPLYTTTFGVGELIRHALDAGCRDFIIGIGGSATNDCGTGMMQALGMRFYDSAGREIRQAMTAQRNGTVEKVDLSGLDNRARESRFTAACDVRNPLLGHQGASRFFGPQKGADTATVEILEKNTEHIIGFIEEAMHSKVRDVPGAGAAGGLGAGLMAVLKADLEPGIEIAMRYARFKERIQGAGVIFTGEGKIDGSTLKGKTIAGIVRMAREQEIPVVVLAGIVDNRGHVVEQLGLHAAIPLCSESIRPEEAMRNAAELLATAAEKAIADFKRNT